MKKESNKLDSKEKNSDKLINDGRETYKADLQNFYNYSEMQKKACKDIERVLLEIQKKNKELSDVEKTYRIQCKVVMEEIEKILEQIDNSRLCAKFVNQVLGGDVIKISKEVLPKILDTQNNTPANINYDEIAQSVFNNYDFCLNEEIEDKPILQDPNNMLRKFKEFEDSILRLLQYKLKVEEEREVSESENEQILDEMKDREKAHQDELEVIRDEYDKVYREWEKIVNNHDMKDTEYANLMMELNKGVLGDNYGNTTKNLKKKQIGAIRTL